MLPSASLGTSGGLYEPIHGSAPDLVGKDLANPLATLFSVALMFRYSFKHTPAAEWIEQAISRTLELGFRTPDIATRDSRVVGSREMGDCVLEQMNRLDEAVRQ
jgi:3-isopropylmalate dehydrogenase